MNQINIAGALLILGFVFIILASLTLPPGLFQVEGSAQKVALVKAYATRWMMSNVFFILAGVVSAGGLILFSSAVQNKTNPFICWSAALAYALGTGFWVHFLRQRLIDPAQLFENYAFTPATIALVAFLLAGLVLYGLVYLQAGFPGWLGLGTVILSVVTGLVAAIFPAQFFAYFPPQALYLFTLVAGIVFLGQ